MVSGSMKPKSNKKPFLIGCGVAAVIVVAVIITLLIMIFTGPQGGVKMSNEMEEYALEYIKKHKLLNSTETLISYYDVTVSSNGSEAAILTSDRVMYHKDGKTTSIALEDINDIQHRYESIIGDIIEIQGNSGTRLKIEIAPFNQGKSFYNALMDAWKSTREEE